jgi:hypothetical protein
MSILIKIVKRMRNWLVRQSSAFNYFATFYLIGIDQTLITTRSRTSITKSGVKTARMDTRLMDQQVIDTYRSIQTQIALIFAKLMAFMDVIDLTIDKKSQLKYNQNIFMSYQFIVFIPELVLIADMIAINTKQHFILVFVLQMR